MRRAWRSARGRWLTPLGEQLGVGVLVAILSALADAVVIRVRLRDDPPPLERLAEATWHLLAQSAPLGVVMGGLVGAALVLVRETPWLEGTRRAMAARRWVTSNPSAFASTLALPVVTLAVVLGAREAQLLLSTRLHDPSLVAWAVGIAAVALVGAGVLFFAGLHLVLRVVGARIGGFATPLGALLLLVGVAGGAAPFLLDAAWSFLLGIDVVAYAWAPGLVLTYVLVAVLVRFALGERGRRRLALVLVPFAVLALLHTGATYGQRGRVRELVEQRSATGQRLVRFYQGMTDRDGDGHSYAFGGEDCDDSNPTIYPGAPDPEGDGIDSDCFDGDGTRSLEGFVGDGRFRAAPPDLHRKNLLFVLVDALRPDHLGSSGYPRATSPHLDAFAERAVVFTNARASSSRSVRSIPSMMTGLYASQLRYGSEYLFPGIREENELLPEVLSEAGYRTAASFGTDYFSPVHGFFQGIDDVVQLDGRGPRHLPVDRALDMLDGLAEGDDPFFLWVYLFNVHLPYLHDRHPSAFGLEPVDAYDTEIQLADAELGRLFAELERRGLADDTVVVLVSDHGEAFGEHNNQGHSFTLYEEEIRSVLMVAAPGVEPRRVDEPVSLIDVAPTVRNLLGLTPPTRAAGRSLVPLIRGTEDDLQSWRDRPLFAELLPDGLFPFDQKAVIRDEQKLIWWVREGRRELYDLARDARERRDLADDRPEEVRELQGLLRAFVAQGLAENRRHDVARRNILPRVPPMQHRLDARFPGFTVLGYDMPDTEVARGDVISMTFYYRVDGQIDDDLFFYVDLRGPGNAQIPQFHAHHYPLNGNYRTDEWSPGEIIRDPVEIVVSDLVPPSARFRATLTVLRDRRLPINFVRDGREDSTIELGHIQVGPVTPE